MQRYEVVPWDIRRADMKPNSEGEYVRYDDAQAERDCLTAERDQALARAEKAEIDAEFFKSEVKLRNRIESTNNTAASLQRKYEEALASAAAAAMEMRERAASLTERYMIDAGVGSASYIEICREVAGSIRNLPIDPDAQKALDKLLAKARGDAIREAAELFTHIEAYPVKSRILARLNDGGQ